MKMPLLYGVLVALLVSTVVFSGLSNSLAAEENTSNGSGTNNTDSGSNGDDLGISESASVQVEANETSIENNESASTQVGTNETSAENNNGEYNDDFEAYSEHEANSENEVTLSTSQYVYKPGDEVELNGSLYSGVLATLPEADKVVSIQIIYSSGEDQVVAKTNVTQISADGKFATTIALPDDIKDGQYEAKAILAVNASVAGGQLSGTEELETSTSFMVISNPESFKIQAEGDNFDVQVASNSTISEVKLKQDEKKLSMVVEGQNGTRGVADIDIPKTLLSGDIAVFIDGKETKNFKIIENTESSIVIEVSYHHSRHTIDVQGTNVVPEFPVPALAAIAATIGAVVVVGRMGRFSGINRG